MDYYRKIIFFIYTFFKTILSFLVNEIDHVNILTIKFLSNKTICVIQRTHKKVNITNAMLLCT